MSGFLQRLIARSRPASDLSIESEHSVRPRVGSRFEPAYGVGSPAVAGDGPIPEESAAADELVPAAPNAPDVHRSADQPARTITLPSPTAAPGNPEPTVTADTEEAQDAGSDSHDTVRVTPTRADMESGKVRKPSEEHSGLPPSGVKPVHPVHPSAAALRKRDESEDTPTSAAEKVVRTIRVVHGTTVSAEKLASEPVTVQSPSDEVRSISSQPASAEQRPVTLESHTLPSPEKSRRQSARTRTERTAKPIRPQVAVAAPTQAAQKPHPGRRQPADPPTIRVTIGRIEVRAEQPSQPPPTQTRRQPVRRTPALSLDDYLAKRNEGGR